tara:strand:+ start:744 stop:1001 length:258 start_codon:yes stop_codon:yes gene_type:complete
MEAVIKMASGISVEHVGSGFAVDFYRVTSGKGLDNVSDYDIMRECTFHHGALNGRIADAYIEFGFPTRVYRDGSTQADVEVYEYE